MTTKPETLNMPCPACGAFSLVGESNITCTFCDYETRRQQLKTAYDYGYFVFRYGHQYKTYYENQLAEKKKIEDKAILEEPHELHVFISLPLLSGILGKTSWFLVKGAIAKIAASYNEQNGTDYTIPEEDIKTLSMNFREFVNDFVNTDEKVRNAVLEEMFSAESNQKEKKKLLALRDKADNTKPPIQDELHQKADVMLENMMKKTFKKISNRPKPTEIELGSFWLKIMD